MPLTGYIDGNAPPFILLGVILASLALGLNVFKELGDLPSPLGLRIIFRYIVTGGILLSLAESFLLIWRIIRNADENLGKSPTFSQVTTFHDLDMWILCILIVLTSWVTILIVGYCIMERKYPKRYKRWVEEK